MIKIRCYPVVKGIYYSDSGCVDVNCTQGVKLIALRESGSQGVKWMHEAGGFVHPLDSHRAINIYTS